MKVAIIGYGKMGHEIEKVLLERGHEWILMAHLRDATLSLRAKDA